MACCCNELRKNLNDRRKFEKIISELNKLSENSGQIHQSLTSFSNACASTFSSGSSLGLNSVRAKLSDDFEDKIIGMKKECNMKIEDLEEQYNILKVEDDLYHKQLNVKNN